MTRPTARRRVLAGVATTLIAALGLTACGSSSDDTPNASGTGTPGTGDHFSDVVVDADWLEANADDDNLVLIEVSTDPGIYERGHIEGAVNVHWHTELVDTVNRDITSREDFTELAQNAGINDDSIVVLYGDRDNWFAAWGAWVFKQYGAEDVRLLDGGRAKWEADGRALTTAPPSPAKGNFEASEPNTDLRAFLPEVLEVAEAENPTTNLVDIRSAAEFSGEIFAPEGFQELAIRSGHIPGAVNVTWSAAVAEDGTFLPVEELRALYAEQGIDGSQPVIVYCRIGERASHTWFILSEILGYDAKLYDGSWTEYGNSVGVPIENPAGTVWGAA